MLHVTIFFLVQFAWNSYCFNNYVPQCYIALCSLGRVESKPLTLLSFETLFQLVFPTFFPPFALSFIYRYKGHWFWNCLIYYVFWKGSILMEYTINKHFKIDMKSFFFSSFSSLSLSHSNICSYTCMCTYTLLALLFTQHILCTLSYTLFFSLNSF